MKKRTLILFLCIITASLITITGAIMKIMHINFYQPLFIIGLILTGLAVILFIMNIRKSKKHKDEQAYEEDEE